MTTIQIAANFTVSADDLASCYAKLSEHFAEAYINVRDGKSLGPTYPDVAAGFSITEVPQ